MTLRRQRIRKIYNHCAQPTCDLHVLRPVKTDFAESQMNKILPVGSPEDHPEVPSSIENLIGPEIPRSGASQKPVKLIDRKHGGRWIIDCLRECLDCDIDENAKRKERIRNSAPG